MKNKFQSNDVGMKLGGCRQNIQRTSNLSPTNHQRLTGSWKYFLTFLLVLAMSIGNVWGGVTTVTFTSANKNDAGNNFANMSSNSSQMVGNGIAKLINASSSNSSLLAESKKDGYQIYGGRCAVVFYFDGTTTLDLIVTTNGQSKRDWALYSFSSTKALSAIVASDYSTKTIVSTGITTSTATAPNTSDTFTFTNTSGVLTPSASGCGKITYSSLAAGFYVFCTNCESTTCLYQFTANVSSGGSTTYSITYDCDGAESGCPANVASATALPNPLPSAPVKDGFTFDGWFTNSTKTTAAVAGATLSANATLYAKWTENAPASSDKLYFWFSKEADATAASVTNNENSFFGGTLPSGSGSVTTSITIDGKKYDVTQYSSSKTPTTTFTVPANKAGKLYAIVKSGGSGRKVQLKKGSTTIQEITWETSATAHDFNAIGPGEYTITSTGNMNWAMFAVKIYDGTFHSVSFDSDGGSSVGSLSVLEGTKATKPADPTKDNNDFAGWVVKSSGVAYNWDAVVNADVELKATWTPTAAKYTVSYFDGETKLGEEEVEENAHPADYADYQAKVCHVFNGWKNNSNADITPASLVVTKDTALYGNWTKVYVAQGTEYVFENYATVGGKTVTTSEKDYDAFMIGNMSFSATRIQYESGTGGFGGWKIKKQNATIKFFVENDSRVTVTVGTLSSSCNIAYTNTSNAAQDVALTAALANAYDVKGGTMVTLTMQGGNTVTLKRIAVSEIPALSDDATLSDLKVGGTTISGFSASKLNYYVQLPYGATSAPAVTATENEEHADVEIVDASAPFPSETTITITAEDGVHKKVYTVHFILEPKQGVELMKALASANDNSAVAGYYGGTYSNGGHKGATVKMEKNYTFGLVLPEGKSFKEGDLFIMNITTAPGSATAMGTLKVYDAADASTPIFESSEVGIVGLNAWALPAAAEGKTALYIKRGNGDDWNPTFSYIGVQRYMAPFIESFEIAGVDAFEIEGTNITASVANSFDVTALTPTVKFWANGGGSIDKTGAKDFTNPVQYTVSSAYTEDAPVTYTVTITKVVPSVEPTITTQPQGANYIEGASIAALTVAAESTAGTLSYQWQIKNGLEFEDIDGATAASYTPTVSAIGSYIYRVVVTNTEDSKPATSVNSDEATIVIAEDPSCKAIGYGAPRALAKNTVVVINATAGLKHISSESSYETEKKIAGESNLTTIKLGGAAAYYDIYTTEMNIGSIALSLTSSSNGEDKRYKYVVIFCSSATFDESKILGVVEQTCGAGDDAQVINTPEVPLGTKLVRIKRQYTYKETTYGQGNSSYIYYLRACLVEPAQEVVADVTAEPASANYCPSDAVTPLAYELTMETGASAAYQWYKGTEAIEGATAATYTPSETGVYSCKAALTKTGRMPKNLISAEATVNFYVATAITAHADAIGDVDAEKTVSVTAEGTNLSYKWQACDENGVVTVETVLGTAASMNVTIAAEAKYYLATVTGACGVETQVVVVREWHEVAPANVTGSRTWDWKSAAWDGITEAIAFANTGVEELMANVNANVPCVDGENGFRADMLYGTGQFVWRPNGDNDNRFFQGTKIRFITEVPGKLIVRYRNTSGSTNTRTIKVTNNGEVLPADGTSTKNSFKNTNPVIVAPGEVIIEGIASEANGLTRIEKIVFNAEPDHQRDVVVGNMGTVCLPNPSRAFGVKVYELAGKGEGCKVQFDQLGENEELEAGKSYVLVMTDTKAKFFYTSTENPVTEADWTTAMKGNLNEEDIHFDPYAEAARNVVFFKNNAMWNAYETGLNVKQYRAYLQYDEVTEPATPAPAPGRRRISLDMNGTNVATGMENVQGNEVQSAKVLINGQLFIIRGEKMYDATGRLVK